MSRYLWCEDSRSGYQFLRAVLGELLPDITVETKGGNTALRKAANKIQPDGNQYYIFMDRAQDNPDVIREAKHLINQTAGKENVHIIWVHSFEFVLLSFELLDAWIFPEEDELREKRKNLLRQRETFIRMVSSTGDAAGLDEFRSTFEAFGSRNSEQIAAKLLYEITRNTGFETGKSKLGDCFIVSCCEWKERKDDDLCGLDGERINAGEKARLLAERSALKEALDEMRM